ncbi:BTAD domain-containing putative transcriptional regulator [Prescottella sp. R16]|uniref:ATP-binding protein n=1 Tax=Prescottella sp. R16 TaxID=3064529 RepID=UPI00272DF5EF|nr:BTAD domain-containing putative transcriptional regulator [Prescottella sp. R16]
MADDIEFAVLGPVTASVGGRPLVFDAEQRAVLAALLVAYPNSVDIERLRGQLRCDDLERSLARLAGRLDPDGDGGAVSVLVREGTRYRLDVPRDAVDATRFVDEVQRGTALHAHAPDTAADAYREGLRLWRGPAFSGIDPSRFVESAYLEAEADRLTELRFEARLALTQAQFQAGEPAAAMSAEALVADHPLEERAWELLVLGLYRSGQTAQARTAIRRCRAMFDDRLGCEIGPGLRRLEAAIASKDSVYLEAAQPSAAPSLGGSNLLLPTTRLIDDEQAISSVLGLFEEHRLVTLVGPEGVGKTRLAVEVCRRIEMPDGPWVVDLTKVSDGALIPSTVATLLRLPGIGSATHLAEILASRECVLVLDNCDHVADYAADVARAIVTACPGMRVVVTGAAPLGVDGEAVFEVEPLPEDAAAALFAERAAGADESWTSSPRNRKAVAVICHEVGGYPLGIELAAAQLRSGNEKTIAAGLTKHFTYLYGRDTATVGPRGRTWDVVDWVYRGLTRQEARLLRRTAVFAGSFDLTAATAVCVIGVPERVSVVLTSLVRRGLLRVVPGSAPPRYRMLSTVRRFARAQVDDAEWVAVQAAHRDYVLGRVVGVEDSLRSARVGQAFTMLASDQAEHRAAFESAFAVGDSHYALELAGRLSWYWYRTGNVGEGLKFVRAALDLVAADWRPPDPRSMARVFDGLASLTYLIGDVPAAEKAVRRAVQLWSSIDEAGEVARDEAWRAHFVAVQGRSGPAIDLARHAVQMAADHEAVWVEAEARTVLGFLLRASGDAEAARVELRAAIAAGERSGNRWAVTSSTWGLMKAAADTGDVDGALATMRVLRADLEDADDVISWLVMVHSTAAVLASAGRPTDGAVLMGAVDTLGAQAGFVPAWIDVVDGPIEAAAVHDALDEQEYQQYATMGAHLNRQQVDRLVGELVEGPQTESD